MCKQCEINPVYEFTNKRKLCKTCFIRWFNKKILYTNRKFKLIQKNDLIGYSNSGNFRDVVLENILLLFSEKFFIETIKLPNKRKPNKIALGSTTDSEAEKIVFMFLEQETISKFFPIQKKQGKIFITPLCLFLDKEVLLYAKLKKLKFKKIKKKNTFIDKLEKNHPEIKRAIIKNFFKE